MAATEAVPTDDSATESLPTFLIPASLPKKLTRIRQLLLDSETRLSHECLGELVAAAIVLDRACVAIPDAGLEWNVKRASQHYSTYTKWTSGTRAERKRVPFAYISHRFRIDEFVEEYKRTYEDVVNAAVSDPASRYPHLFPGYSSKVTKIEYNPQNTDLSISLAPSNNIPSAFTNAPLCLPLDEWHLHQAPARGDGTVQLTEAAVLAQPRLLRLLNCLLQQVTSGKHKNITMVLRAVRRLLPPLHGRTGLRYTMKSQSAKRETWRVQVDGIGFLVPRTRLLTHTSMGMSSHMLVCTRTNMAGRKRPRRLGPAVPIARAFVYRCDD